MKAKKIFRIAKTYSLTGDRGFSVFAVEGKNRVTVRTAWVGVLGFDTMADAKAFCEKLVRKLERAAA